MTWKQWIVIGCINLIFWPTMAYFVFFNAEFKDRMDRWRAGERGVFDAFNIDRDAPLMPSLGFNKKDISKDSDLDGLDDQSEELINTDKNLKDTDGDGFDDFTEVYNFFNPTGSGKLSISLRDEATKILIGMECLSPDEAELGKLLNKYRNTKLLHSIPFSKSLNFIAETHLNDLIKNKPFLGAICDQHSWSESDRWTGGCKIKHGPNEVGHPKARELLTGYNSDVYEIANSIWHGTNEYTRTPLLRSELSMKDHLDGWKASHGHNIMILNREAFRKFDWKAMGVAVRDNYALVWFGPIEDPNGVAGTCQN